MFLYNVGYGTMEESELVQLWHKERFSSEELETLVHQATTKALEYAIECAEEDIAHWDEEDYRSKDRFYFHKQGISFQELFPRIIVELEKLGFTRATFEEEFSAFGWASVCGEDWKGYTNETTTRLRNALPESLKNKAVEIGIKIEELMNQDLEDWAKEKASAPKSSPKGEG